MQIEQTFRDLKNHRHGWFFEDVRSKAARRIDVLMLVGAFSAVAFHLVVLAVPDKLEREISSQYGAQAARLLDVLLGQAGSRSRP